MIDNRNNAGELDDGTVLIGQYVVLFMDVLNQREAIRRLEKLPTNKVEHAGYVSALKDSKGKVEGLRKILRTFYASYRDAPSVAPIEQLNTEQRAVFDRLKAGRSSLSFQGFADTVVAFAPLTSSDSGVLPVDSLYAVLAAAGSALMTSLAAGVPIRGGLDINVALVFPENDLYGPAALEAFRLESEVAQYPRVAIGKNVLEFLHTVLASTQGGLLAQTNREMAKVCLSLLETAPDAVPFVNFLGTPFRKILDGSANNLFSKGLDFARREHEKFLAVGNQKLAGRYSLLRQYFEVHEREWFPPATAQ
jgi:hypothetical protein